LWPRSSSPAERRLQAQVVCAGSQAASAWRSFWGNAWIEFSVQEVDPDTHEARGMIHVRVINDFGLKRLWFEPKCVSFTEVNGKPAATVVAVIVRREGWDDIPTAGDPGEYLKWQLVDAGTPANDGDSWSIQYYDQGNWIEYWPTFPDDGCENFQSGETNCPVHGNLVIH
jgi:hypothetical protein